MFFNLAIIAFYGIGWILVFLWFFTHAFYGSGGGYWYSFGFSLPSSLFTA
ncbi:MAG TPA: hypothetical protein PKC54_05205 [Ferruginibacter sp.]|nr:hypothetical protein [Ferruginibacter sp.]